MAEEMKTDISIDHMEKKKKKRKLSPKAALVLVCAVLVIIVIIVAVFAVSRHLNNGKRYAERLSEQIGVSKDTAEKYAHVTLQNASQFACINVAAEPYPYLYESKKTVKVSGVSIPQWVIYISENNGSMSEVLYYDYAQLEKYGNGVKTDQHVETSGITIGMSPDAVQQYIGFAPLRISYNADGMQEAYKYYYKDQNTGNTVSYILYVNYTDGKAASAAEEENQFILSMLTVK